MKVLQREIQQIRRGKWAELEELDKKFNEVERRLGFPANKRRYRCYFGGHDVNTIAVEYEWENLAAMEAAYESAMADPEWQALGAELEASILKSNHMELYVPMP